MKVSIIIPVYNKIKYIRTILEQVKDQTFDDFECILIDDGSTDGSETICDEFAASDERFCVFHIPNGGVSNARNIGLDAAKGEYITFVDADDQIHREYLFALVDGIERSGADLIIGAVEKVWEDKNERKVYKYPGGSGMVAMDELLPTFLEVQRTTGLYGCCCAKLFSAAIIRDIRFDKRIKLAEDFDFYLKLYERISTIYFDDNALYYYLQEAENSTGKISDEKIDYVVQLEIWIRCRTMLQKRNAYSGKNREIVEERINSYVYFSLFHCPRERFNEVFVAVRKICKDEKIVLAGSTMLQKLMFYWLKRHNEFMLRIMMWIYHNLRGLLRKGI